MSSSGLTRAAGVEAASNDGTAVTWCPPSTSTCSITAEATGSGSTNRMRLGIANFSAKQQSDILTDEQESRQPSQNEIARKKGLQTLRAMAACGQIDTQSS